MWVGFIWAGFVSVREVLLGGLILRNRLKWPAFGKALKASIGVSRADGLALTAGRIRSANQKSARAPGAKLLCADVAHRHLISPDIGLSQLLNYVTIPYSKSFTFSFTMLYYGRPLCFII
jgi:hypothetical protein